jgi:excisionase family DNA binding protein
MNKEQVQMRANLVPGTQQLDVEQEMKERANSTAYEPSINTKKAACILGVHPNTLLLMARRKEVPAYRVGRRWLFVASSLVRWRDQRLQSASPSPASSEGAIH